MKVDGIEHDYGKFANNTEKHGEKWKSGWTLPLAGNFTVEEFEAAFDRKFDGRRYFDTKKGEKYYGMKGFIKGRFSVELEYENAAATIVFTGGREVEFEDGCGISGITFLPIDGGMINVAYNLYVHPTVAQKKLLDDNQHSTLTVSISNATVATKGKDKQKDMFAGEGDPDETDAGAAPDGVGKGFAEAAARKQAEAWSKGKPIDPPDTH